MKGTKLKIFATIFFLSTLLQFTPTHQAHAAWANTPLQIWQGITALYQEMLETSIDTSAYSTASSSLKTMLNDNLDRIFTRKLKDVFVKWLNRTITEEFKTGNTGGTPFFVTDWQDYLYKKPQEFAANYIENEFLRDKLSGKKCLTGDAGSHYYDYLCTQAQKILPQYNPDGTLKNIVKTTLPELFLNEDGSTNTDANPQENLFLAGDMKAFTSYFECGNNPYCATNATEDLFKQITGAQKEVAEKEASGEGALPKKNPDHSIAIPSKLFEESMTKAISSGNEMILNSQNWQEIVIAMASNGIYSIMDKALNTALNEGQNYVDGFENKYIKGTFYEEIYGF